jgi:hypothetical protein
MTIGLAEAGGCGGRRPDLLLLADLDLPRPFWLLVRRPPRVLLLVLGRRPVPV